MRRSRKRSKEGSFEGPRYIPASRYIIPGNEDIDTPSRDFCTSPAAFAEATERAVAQGAMIIKLVASKAIREVRATKTSWEGDDVNALLIGATGYVGSHVAKALRARGHIVTGSARSADNARALRETDFSSAVVDFDDLPALGALAGSFEIVVMASKMPFEREAVIMEAIVAGCTSGATQHLLLTTGTAMLTIAARDGAWSQYSFAEDDRFPFARRHDLTVRAETETRVRRASGGRLNTYVIRPPLIFGNGGSIQIPAIFDSVRKTGFACYVGHGLNLYSAVHVEDLARIYPLAIERGTPGALYHAVCGEANFRSIAEAVAAVAGCGTRSLTYEQACALWGEARVERSLAANSRTIAKRTVEELGWRPTHLDVIEDIRSGSYREAYRLATGSDIGSSANAQG